MKRPAAVVATVLATLIASNLFTVEKAHSEDISEAGQSFGLRGISWEMTPREIYDHAKSNLYMDCTPFTETTFFCEHQNSSRQWPHAIEKSWISFGFGSGKRPIGIKDGRESISFSCEFLDICAMHVNDVATRMLDLDKLTITGREEGPLGSIHLYGEGHRGEVIVLHGYPSVQSHIPANIGTLTTVYKGGFK